MCIRPCVSGYCPAERWIYLPVSGGKQTEPGFPLGFWLFLALFHIFFIWKNFTVVKDYKHNMMQPPLCLKIWRVILSDAYCWICPKHNTLYSGQKVYCFATYFCSITLVPRCKQDARFGIFLFCAGFFIFTLSIKLVLWCNYDVVDPSSVFSYHSLKL